VYKFLMYADMHVTSACTHGWGICSALYGHALRMRWSSSRVPVHYDQSRAVCTKFWEMTGQDRGSREVEVFT
jgi:hypothetical protein